jgi:predicted HicB family RNase H-like nuclease
MKVGVLVRVAPEVRDEWRAAAEDRQVSVNEMIREAVTRHLGGQNTP